MNSQARARSGFAISSLSLTPRHSLKNTRVCPIIAWCRITRIKNLSKVCTMITMSTTISIIHHLHAYLANICTIIEAQFHCNLMLLDIKTPVMFWLHDHLPFLSCQHPCKYTSRKATSPQATCPLGCPDDRPAMHSAPASSSSHQECLPHCQNKICNIQTDKFHLAFILLDNCISTLRKFECGTGTIPSIPLLQADRFKHAKTKQDKLLE